MPDRMRRSNPQQTAKAWRTSRSPSTTPSQKKNGEKVQRVEWVRCVAWNKQAEIAERFVTKGKQIFVEGRLQTRRYEDSEGAPRIISEVVVTTLRVLGGTTKDTHGQAAD